MRIEVKNLLEQARKDLEVAKKNLEIKEYYSSVFWCQQSVEKYLKAFYIVKKSKFPEQTHSLIYLAKQTNIPERFYEVLRSLTPEFITTRYPDVAGDAPYKLYDKEKTDNYLTKASELIKWIESQINKQ